MTTNLTQNEVDLVICNVENTAYRINSNGDLITLLPNPFFKPNVQNARRKVQTIGFLAPIFFEPIKIIVKHFSKKITNFQGRLKY